MAPMYFLSAKDVTYGVQFLKRWNGQERKELGFQIAKGEQKKEICPFFPEVSVKRPFLLNFVESRGII